ncbi:hypothetical protein J2783_001810 [Chryseobacterium sediminis]|nr:hypothetical protein [Chryseobacterium sediminis]
MENLFSLQTEIVLVITLFHLLILNTDKKNYQVL